ncbi:GNAT family N-acetyltransferase [Paludicola sp. MB14-C6]|uniref:GNAT family N-acetyltransferase n=1 Tax=Paludihabitans sp. MB14-C6 TaxID=3070656 RepID=UPI0027DD560F|nr:GNAT family N-acetyltransferase [Paludicola sp. MB14-C6]WMJ22225.1 GNAT family N-acetyltransferase [Paludicola sp. MB14-C6]
MNIMIRKMIPLDVESMFDAFHAQGWNKPIAILNQYMQEQIDGTREVFVAANESQVMGYATLLPYDSNGPFANKNIPCISDFNVFEPFQNKGIGNKILDAIESHAKQYSETICLGVGLHSGYGSAQRMYIKRGYIPDGSGVWFQNQIATPYAPCINDDDLILYMSKKL